MAIAVRALFMGGSWLWIGDWGLAGYTGSRFPRPRRGKPREPFDWRGQGEVISGDVRWWGYRALALPPDGHTPIVLLVSVSTLLRADPDHQP